MISGRPGRIPADQGLKIVLPILVLLLLAGGVFAARNACALMGAGLGLAASIWYSPSAC